MKSLKRVFNGIVFGTALFISNFIFFANTVDAYTVSDNPRNPNIVNITESGYWGLIIDKRSIVKLGEKHVKLNIRYHGMAVQYISEWFGVDVSWNRGFRVVYESNQEEFNPGSNHEVSMALVKYLSERY